MTEVIELTEYVETYLSLGRFARETGNFLYQEYGKKLDIEFPTPKTDNRWRLYSEGYVGYIPVDKNLGISIQPKVPISNVFRMLEYAYQLKSFQLLDKTYESSSLSEFYENLASILARRVLARARKGYYREYLNIEEQTSFVTGKLDLRHMIRKPWMVKPRCSYQEYTADIEENQLLAWTLFAIGHSGLCSDRVAPIVRKAYRSIQGFITLYPFRTEDCLNRTYNRLNEDYGQMHALCRFFLDNSGPTHQMGERTMIPFLVNMAALFEKFVAEWLEISLPERYELRKQEKANIDQEGNIYFLIDLVLYDRSEHKIVAVLDTKYKKPEVPAAGDIEQMIAYAHIKGCKRAILIYPEPLVHPLDEGPRDIHLRSMTFSLHGDLEKAGQEFIRQLLNFVKE